MERDQSLEVYAPVKPLVTPEQAQEEWRLFEALKSRILVDDDYQPISGKRYIKRSGFRKIAVYFGLSDRLLEQERSDRDDGSFMWRIVVEVAAPNGRVSTGVGVCDSRERNFAHVEHDVYATCHTRAKSRAISDMVAGGVVSAEEMEVSDAGRGDASRGGPPSSTSRMRVENEGPAPEEEGVLKALEEAGLDASRFNIYPYGRRLYIDPPPSLGLQWNDYDRVLAPLGAVWVEIGQGGRWELSL